MDALEKQMIELKPKNCNKMEELEQNKIYTITKIFRITDSKHAIFIKETNKCYLANYFLNEIILKCDRDIYTMPNLIIKTIKEKTTPNKKKALFLVSCRDATILFYLFF